MVYPVDKWVLKMLESGAIVRNLKDIRWHATEDGSKGPGTGRHVACFILEPEGFKKKTTKVMKSLTEITTVKTDTQGKLKL
jgi:hypothetical protein